MTLPNTAFFPQALMPLHIFEPRYREMLRDVLASNRLFAVAGLDLERLNDFAGGDPDNFNELVSLYVKQTGEQLEQFQAALADKDAERAARIAHSCAGASATCGMVAIVPLLRQAEHLGHEGDLAALPDILAAIDDEFVRLKSYLQSHKPIALAG